MPKKSVQNPTKTSVGRNRIFYVAQGMYNVQKEVEKIENKKEWEVCGWESHMGAEMVGQGAIHNKRTTVNCKGKSQLFIPTSRDFLNL